MVQYNPPWCSILKKISHNAMHCSLKIIIIWLYLECSIALALPFFNLNWSLQQGRENDEHFEIAVSVSLKHSRICQKTPTKCQEKSTRTSRLHLGLIRDAFNGGRWVLISHVKWHWFILNTSLILFFFKTKTWHLNSSAWTVYFSNPLFQIRYSFYWKFFGSGRVK